MRYLLLAAALLLSGAAGALLGSGLAERVAASRSRARGKKAFASQAMEDPVLLFVTFAAISCVAAVAFGPWVLPPCLLISAVMVRKAPAFIAKRRREQLRSDCDRHLDILCDIVAMGVGAGLSFDAALELYCQRFDNPLSQRLAFAQRRWTHGIASRSDALRGLAEEVGSPALKRFADTAVHGISHGSPLAGMLRQLGADLRQLRRTSVERQVEKASVKMLVPTGVCILPAMLLVVMGPMLLQFMGS